MFSERKLKIKNSLFFTFASSTIILLGSGSDANASLKKQYKQTSACSYETAIFKGKPFKSAFSNSTISPRYCITPGKQIIKYYGPDSSGEIVKGKVCEKEIYWNDFHSSYYLIEFEINGDKLISYSCATSNSNDCSGIPKRYVVGTKTNNKYPTYTWENGDQYIGKFVNGKQSGKGIFKWANGDYYEGDFAIGNRTGYGRHMNSKGRIIYKGKFLNGEFLGK